MVRCLVSILLLAASVSAHSLSNNCDDSWKSDALSLACNVYFEAHTEGYEGMFAVATTTLNRVGSEAHPDTVREVVWYPKAFSWTNDGKSHIPTNADHWRTALKIAKLFTISNARIAEICPTATQINAALLGRADPGCESYEILVSIHVILASHLDPTGGALFYYAKYIPPPYWVFEEKHSRTIGKHRFYTAALER